MTTVKENKPKIDAVVYNTGYSKFKFQRYKILANYFFILDDNRFALVQWKQKKALFSVIPMSDFVKLESTNSYSHESDYWVRFGEQAGGKSKLNCATLKFIGIIYNFRSML